MKDKINKIFHTDKWLGKFIFIICIYISYLILGYILIPFLISVLQGFNFGGIIMFIFLFLIIPIFSYYIPSFILKIFEVNKTLLYFLHTIFIILVPFVFLWIIIALAFSHFSIG